MKKIMLSLAIGLLCCLGMNLTAQPLSINNGTTEYDDKQRAAIHVKLEPATKDVKAAWEDYIEDKYDVKVKGFGFLTNKDVLKAEKVKIKGISDKEMDLNNKILETKNGTEMMVFASLGYDIYLSPNGEYAQQYRALETLVYDFLDYYLPKHYAGQIEKAEKAVSDFTNTKSELEKDINKNKEDIEKMKKEIEEKTKENENKSKELTKTIESLTTAQTTLTERKAKVSTIKTMVSSGKQ